MNILVINGSPKGGESTTLKVTRAFLDGMGESAEVFDTASAGILPCLGCYACWHRTPGKCVRNDGTADVLKKMRDADLVIWSTPLYCYSVPSSCKALIDRMLPLSCPTMYVDDEGRTHHPAASEADVKFMLISSCGFPEREGNFDALIFQFERMFGADLPKILCVEAPLLSIPEAAPAAEPYLAAARSAGEEYKRDGRISDETQRMLDAPMFPPDEYRREVNGQ